MVDNNSSQFDPSNTPEVPDVMPDVDNDVLKSTVDPINRIKDAQAKPPVTKPAPSLSPDQPPRANRFFDSFNRFISPNPNARIKDTVTTNKVGNAVNSAKNEAKGEVKKIAGKAVRKVGTEIIKTGAKQAAAWAARAIAVATSEIWLPILIIVIIIVGGGVAIAAAVAIGHNAGSSTHQNSIAQTQKVTLAGAGDLVTRRELDSERKTQLYALLDEVKKLATSKPPKGRPAPDAEAIALIDDIRTKLETYSSNDTTVDKKNIDSIANSLLKLASIGYDEAIAGPAGLRIAEKARYFITDPKGIQEFNTCDESDRTACNAFVIKVMHKTGADIGYTGSAMDQYNYTKNRTDCYDVFTVGSATELAQGDIVFRPRLINGHGHVAIYVGQGNIAAASLGTSLPKIKPWYSGLSSAARMKVDVCPKK